MKSTRSTKASRRTGKGINASNQKNASDTGLSPSKRHREKLNSVMDELCDLLPLSRDAKTGLDRLSVLKLTVSFFQTQNLTIQSGNDKSKLCIPKRSKDEQARRIVEGLNLSELALQAIGGFFVVLTEDGVVYYISENVKSYLGYPQTRLMHQDFFPHVHADDLQGLKACFDKSLSEKNDGRLTGEHQECFCNIRCHAGRLSSHVSPFYYKCFKFNGHLKILKNKSINGNKYGFFALCSPVSRQIDVFRPLTNNVEKYTCKMDASMNNLEVDTRGLKFLQLGEKDLVGRSSYCFFHPDDLGGMALAHERLLHDSKVCVTFRVLKGSGKWQWVRGRAYSIVNHGKVEGMVSKNLFLSDEEGVYFKEQDMKEIQEWKVRQTIALPCSQQLGSSSSANSGSLSPVSDDLSFHSFPIATLPVIDIPSQNNPVISSPDDIFCRQDQDCGLVFKHKKIKSSCLVNDEPASFKNDMDSDTMLKIIKDLQSSLIDGTNSRMPFFAAQSDVDLLTGAPFSDMVLPDNDFLGSKPSNGRDLGFVQGFGSQAEGAVFVPGNHSGSHGLHGVPQHSNGLMQFNEKLAFPNNTTENTCRDNESKGEVSTSVVHMDEYSFTDFVPLPLVEVENILSNDQCAYAMTSNSASLTTYDLPPRQPIGMTGYPRHQAYHTNSYSSNEQLQCVGGGYELHPPINTLPCQDFMSKDNVPHYKACTEPYNTHAAGSKKLL